MGTGYTPPSSIADRIRINDISDNIDLDAFHRFKVVNPRAVFARQNQYNLSPLWMVEVLTNNATIIHLPNESSARLRCTTTDTDKAIWQSRIYHRYQPGKSQEIAMTAVMGAAKANVRKRMGYFDGDNGIFFEQDENNLKIVVRSKASGSVVDSAINQSSWNLDKLDGSGPSKKILDMSKIQIFIFDIQWLGAGRIRFGFDFGDTQIWCHEFNVSNTETTVSMTTANLPIRYEIENTGAVADNTDFICTCQAVVSDGGAEEGAIHHSANMGVSSLGVTTRVAVMTIRPKITFNSIVNRGHVFPQNWHMLVTTNDALIEIIRNGALGGTPSYTSAGADSIVEFDIAGTTVTGGELVDSFYVKSGQGSVAEISELVTETPFPLVTNFAGDDSETCTLVATAMTGTTNIVVATDWIELY